MSEDEDFAWLKNLHAELSRADTRTPGQKLADRLSDRPGPEPAREKLTHEEVKRIGDLIVKHKLITELFPCGMICGVGMAVYGHELYPGTGPVQLICVRDGNLPGFEPLSWHEHLMGKEAAKLPKRVAGDIDPFAWALFSKYATRPENTAWLKQYKLRPVKDKIHYDY
jgi:hypothetical protein